MNRIDELRDEINAERISSAKSFFEYMAEYAEIPPDCCSALDDHEWLKLVTDREDGFLHKFPEEALTACVFKLRPNAKIPAEIDQIIGEAKRLKALYESALRQGFGTLTERGALLSDDLGL